MRQLHANIEIQQEQGILRLKNCAEYQGRVTIASMMIYGQGSATKITCENGAVGNDLDITFHCEPETEGIKFSAHIILGDLPITEIFLPTKGVCELPLITIQKT